ncbi:MAG: FkbM family methyltransferase [Asgard group archaeon]|nr:FkbM family methyltransferase [Asgard group archaeon]
MNKHHVLNIKGYKLNLTYNSRKTGTWLKWRFRKESIHEKNVVELLFKKIKPDMCFVDVGAYLGFYSVLTSKILTNGEVISFEMNKNSYEILNKNLEINECYNVITTNKAVTDYNGTAKYVTNGIFTSALSQLDKQLEHANINEDKVVETTTLDAFFKNNYKKPDIIKIDVEGAEMNVLNGMENILNQNKNLMLFVEIHPNHLKHKFKSSEKEVLSKLMDIGFSVFQIKNIRRSKEKMELKQLNMNTNLRYNTMIYAQK